MAKMALVFAFRSLYHQPAMGGPRASTERQVRRGFRCAKCASWIAPEDRLVDLFSERVCDRCQPQPVPALLTKTRRVLMTFFRRAGWTVNFLEADCQTPVGRIRTFADEVKVRELFERCAESRVLSERQALDAAISKGRGSCWLLLTDEQCQKLQQ